MTLSQFIDKLEALRRSQPEAGDLPVFYRHGASGDCGELSTPFISDEINECGPFDVEPGCEYVAIYAGN